GTIRLVAVAIRAIAVLGIAIFGTLAIVATKAPELVERAARGYLTDRLRAEVIALRSDAPEIAVLIPDAQVALAYAARLRALEQRGSAAAEVLLDRLLTCLCKDACGDRIKARTLLQAALKAVPEETQTALRNLQAIAQGRFDSILAKLRHELTLVAVVNVAIF